LHLQGKIVIQERNQYEAGSKQLTPQRYVPGDRKLRTHRCKNLNSYTAFEKFVCFVGAYFSILSFCKVTSLRDTPHLCYKT
jgi:hypothetical protein